MSVYDDFEKSHARLAAKQMRLTARQTHLHAHKEVCQPWQKFIDTLAQPSTLCVAGFWPLAEEIDVRPLLQVSAQAGLRLALPCTGRKGHALRFRSYQIGDKLRGGAYGTSEPFASQTLLTPDIIILPLLAYNDKGGRLGYGGGFYDRTLAKLRKIGHVFACGLAYDEQNMPRLPMAEFDERLDAMLTPSGLQIFCHPTHLA